jgi:hypothetical protein
MKKILLLCLFIAGQAACDREFDLFTEVGKVNLSFEESEITELLKLTNGVLKDSIKLGQVRTYNIDIGGGSDKNTLQIDRLNPSPTVDFYLNSGEAPITSPVEIGLGRNVVGVKGVAEGSGKGSMTITDVYNRMVIIPYEFTVFYNIPPVCRLSVMPIKELSPYEALIDLSASTDGDEKFGGYITQYEYRIGGYYRLNTGASLIYHIFPTHGAYEILCRVRDSDGVWSDFTTETIILQTE